MPSDDPRTLDMAHVTLRQGATNIGPPRRGAEGCRAEAYAQLPCRCINEMLGKFQVCRSNEWVGYCAGMRGRL